MNKGSGTGVRTPSVGGALSLSRGRSGATRTAAALLLPEAALAGRARHGRERHLIDARCAQLGVSPLRLEAAGASGLIAIAERMAHGRARVSPEQRARMARFVQP